MPHHFHSSLVQYANQHFPPVGNPPPVYQTLPLSPPRPPQYYHQPPRGGSMTNPGMRPHPMYPPMPFHPSFAPMMALSRGPVSPMAPPPPPPPPPIRRPHPERKAQRSVTFQDLNNANHIDANKGDRPPPRPSTPRPPPLPQKPTGPSHERRPHRDPKPTRPTTFDDIKEYNLTGYNKGTHTKRRAPSTNTTPNVTPQTHQHHDIPPASTRQPSASPHNSSRIPRRHLSITPDDLRGRTASGSGSGSAPNTAPPSNRSHSTASTTASRKGLHPRLSMSEPSSPKISATPLSSVGTPPPSPLLSPTPLQSTRPLPFGAPRTKAVGRPKFWIPEEKSRVGSE